MTSSAGRGGVVAVLAFCALSVPVTAGPARFVSIDYPDAAATWAFGINPAGDVVGAYVDGAGYEHGFVLRGATFTSLDYPGAAWTEGYGITPQGDVVGQYGLPGSGVIHGFLLRNGNFYPVDVPGQPNSMPLGVSPEGVIVGCVHGGSNGMHGFVAIADGDASVQGPAGTMHTGINPLADVVGYGTPNPPGSDSSYVVSNGVTSWFAKPGSTFTRARGINAAGDIVGVFQDAGTGTTHGFLLRRGEFVTIDVDLPGATTRAFGINAGGDVVGYYVDSAKKPHGFMMSHGQD